MWPFRKSPQIDADTAAWLAENFDWLESEFGTVETAELICPEGDFFPVGQAKGHDLALALFDHVKAHAGMSDWRVNLVPDDDPLASTPGGEVINVASQAHAAGRFMADESGVTITYVPALLSKPQHLIATLAHELAHYLLATAQSEPPADEDEHEYLTDLTAIYLGFGVFLANARFTHDVVALGTSSGVAWSRAGYLLEADLVFATALFAVRSGADDREASRHLKPHLQRQFEHAIRDLRVGGAHHALAKRAPVNS